MYDTEASANEDIEEMSKDEYEAIRAESEEDRENNMDKVEEAKNKVIA